LDCSGPRRGVVLRPGPASGNCPRVGRRPGPALALVPVQPGCKARARTSCYFPHGTPNRIPATCSHVAIYPGQRMDDQGPPSRGMGRRDSPPPPLRIPSSPAGPRLPTHRSVSSAAAWLTPAFLGAPLPFTGPAGPPCTPGPAFCRESRPSRAAWEELREVFRSAPTGHCVPAGGCCVPHGGVVLSLIRRAVCRLLCGRKTCPWIVDFHRARTRPGKEPCHQLSRWCRVLQGGAARCGEMWITRGSPSRLGNIRLWPSPHATKGRCGNRVRGSGAPRCLTSSWLLGKNKHAPGGWS